MDALPQFRQSASSVLGRLTQEGLTQKEMMEEEVKGRMGIDQLKDMAEQTGIKAKTDLGQNISMGGIEIHSIYSAMKNKNLLQKVADARDQLRKKFSKGEEEEPEEEEPTEEVAPERPLGEVKASEYPKLEPEEEEYKIDEPTEEEPKPELPEEPEGEGGISETAFGETPMTAELGELETTGLEATEEATSGLLSGLGEALSGVGEAVSGALGTAGDVLGPLGVVASLGMGIYDTIEEGKQEAQEKAQATKTQNEINELANKPSFSSGSRALPSFDTTQFRSGSLMNF